MDFLYFLVQLLSLDGPYFRTFFSATSEKLYWGFLLHKFASDGLETIMKRSASKVCISQLRRHVKQSSWSNFMAMSIRFILQWRSRLHRCFLEHLKEHCVVVLQCQLWALWPLLIFWSLRACILQQFQIHYDYYKSLEVDPTDCYIAPEL